MRNFILIVLIITLIPVSNSVAEFMSAGFWNNTAFVGWWKFNEGSGTSAADASKHVNTGTLVHSPTWTTGPNGTGALNFGGTSYVTTTNPSNYSFGNASPFSISLWVNMNNLSASIDETFVGKAITGSAITGFDFNITPFNCPNKVKIYIISNYAGGDYISTCGSTALTTGNWFHVVVTYSGNGLASGVKFYVNNSLETNTVVHDALSGSIVNSNVIYIGGRNSDESDMLDGIVDDVRIFNRALTAADVSRLYTNLAQ